MVTALPVYLNDQVVEFISNMVPIPQDSEQARMEELAASKTKKINDALYSIQVRVERWNLFTPKPATIFESNDVNSLVPYTTRWPLFVHISCAIFMMGASAFFHNYWCMNSDSLKLRKFDLAGICMMIMGSCTPPFYYGM